MKPAEPIEYPLNGAPAPGETLEVAPGVHWLRLPLPFELNHVNVWLLEEADGWTVIDTGLHLQALKEQWEGLLAARCAVKPLRRIVVTHCHPDHLGLARWLAARTGAGVWISLGELLTARAWYHQLPNHDVGGMVAFFRRHGLDEARAGLLLARGPTYRDRVDGLPHEYHRLLDGARLEIGGRQWRVIVGHGHSPEHVALYCAALDVLISGDMLLPRISTNVSVMSSMPEEDPLQLFLDSLARFEALPATTLVLPSHGRPFRGLHERVEQLRRHHAERCAALRAACTTPKSAGELIPTLFGRPLDAHQTLFALGETIAHLNHLVHAGGLRRSETGGVWRFSTI